MGTSITGVIGGPHDFLPARSDEFQNLYKRLVLCDHYHL
jgi:hypothetical protein